MNATEKQDFEFLSESVREDEEMMNQCRKDVERLESLVTRLQLEIADLKKENIKTSDKFHRNEKRFRVLEGKFDLIKYVCGNLTNIKSSNELSSNE